jgi:hypothetical protein
VPLPPALVAAIKRRQAEILEETAKAIKNQDVGLQAFALWLTVDGLGLKEAVQRAKVEKAKVLMESNFQDKPFVITIAGEDAAEVFKALREAVMGEKQWIPSS